MPGTTERLVPVQLVLHDLQRMTRISAGVLATLSGMVHDGRPLPALIDGTLTIDGQVYHAQFTQPQWVALNQDGPPNLVKLLRLIEQLHLAIRTAVAHLGGPHGLPEPPDDSKMCFIEDVCFSFSSTDCQRYQGYYQPGACP